jgi:rhodanese-related sulfurtransferase
MNSRYIKDRLYEQVARIGKAASSPKRLELIELLCQGEKNVEQLATEADISVKLASAHLGALKAAALVKTRRAGKSIYYRLSDPHVAEFWVAIRTVAEERLVELQVALDGLVASPAKLTGVDRAALLEDARRGELIVLDVRPKAEYAAGHLPFARSIPLAELERRIAELPKDKTVVAYCRGPFCLFAHKAVALLGDQGYRACRLEDGVAEWRAHGFPIEATAR